MDDGTEQRFNSPVEQVILQEIRLRKWLRLHQFPPYPLEKVIVYSNKNTILKNVINSETISQMIIHKESLLRKVEQYKKMHTTQALTITQLDNLIIKLIAAHTPKIVNVMDRYEVSQNQLIQGIICANCGVNPMIRYKGQWFCRECKAKSKTAHVSALEDYRMLVGNTITNRQARSFLAISSANVAKQLLQRERLKFTGNTSARKYFLS